MTKIEIYRLLHFAGIFTLLIALGASFTGNKTNKSIAIWHGVGLLLILVSGFGMQAVYKLGFPSWLIIKIVIWIIFGGFIVFAKRGLLKQTAAWVLILLMALSSAYLGRNKDASFPAKERKQEKVSAISFGSTESANSRQNE